jgi:HPt (histidine-containing phosphotransfer) domain-containing protein
MSENQVKAQIAEYLRQNMGFDDDSIQQFIEMLLDTVGEYIPQAESNFTAGEWQELSRVGHSIKGSAANIGATAISEAGKKLEFGAKSADADECRTAIADLKEKLAELRQ